MNNIYIYTKWRFLEDSIQRSSDFSPPSVGKTENKKGFSRSKEVGKTAKISHP